jgi:NitT/TauT family transport system substrate-binding protein
MRRTSLIAAAALMLLAWAPGAQAGDAPLQVYGNLQTIELAPVLYAADAFSPIPVEVKMGGIPNLVGEAGAQGFASPGVADLATNAETQLLRFSVRHPDLRIIFNVTEGLYRIVARRSSGSAASPTSRASASPRSSRPAPATSSTACSPPRASASTTSPRCR